MTTAAVIFGATGGIGSALVEATAASGRFAEVHAVARRPAQAADGVRRHIADVTNEGDVERVARDVAGGVPVGLVLIATGILHGDGISPEKALKAIDPVALARVFAVNALGPAIVAKHFVPLLPRRGRSVIVALSARVGSIEDNRLGGWYAYRASKAALNQLVRTLAIELGRTRPDAIALALHPGTVLTALSEPFRGDAPKAGTFVPAEAAANLLKVIDEAGPESSGRVLAWDGSCIPY